MQLGNLLIGVAGDAGANTTIKAGAPLILISSEADTTQYTSIPFVFVPYGGGMYSLQRALVSHSDLYLGYLSFWTPENKDPGPYPLGLTSQYAATKVYVEDTTIYICHLWAYETT